MEPGETDYLNQLPDEVKLQIFSYLDTYDIIQLEEVSRSFQHLTFDKKLISTIRLHKEYRCSGSHLRSFVLHKLRQELITSLNINCVYWVSKNELKKCLKLSNLQCLYAVDTQLGVDDLIDSELPHLHTLAITFSCKNFLSYSKLTIFNNIKCLYIHYDIPNQLYLISAFIQYCQNLKELWFIDLSNSVTVTMGFFCIINKIPSTVDKIVMTYHESLNPVTMMNLSFDVSSFQTFTAKSHLCLERTANTNVINLYDDSFYQAENWKSYIVQLKCDFPFGIEDARKLVFKETTLEDIQWHELNLSHHTSLCNTFYRTILDTIILTPNAKRLKKLSINTCSGQPRCMEIEKRAAVEPLFKKARKSCISSEKSTLQEIITNSPFLEELEIWECEMVLKGLPKLNNDALSSIRNLKHLQKLTLSGVPNYVSPKYLIDICQSCVNLTSLRVSSPQQNAALNNFLCLSIPHAKSLKDLRFEHSTIPLSRLVESFGDNSSSKLERLMLKCNDISTFETESFVKFIEHNRQLRFLCLCLMKIPKNVVQNISRELKKLKSPEQVFLVTDGKSSLQYTVIPHIHKMEMVDFNTTVSALDIFNGFVK